MATGPATIAQDTTATTKHGDGRASLMLLLGGWLLGALVLVATAPSGEYPVRELGAELGVWALVYPPMAAVAWFCGQRRGRRMGLVACAVFALAVVVRVSASCWMTAYYARVMAPMVGASNSDCYLYSLAARYLASGLTGQSYHTDVEYQASENLARVAPMFLGGATAAAGGESVFALSGMAMPGALIALTGYSTMALNLFTVLLGGVVCVQVLLLLSRFAQPKVVALVTLWVVVGWEYVWFSAGYFKETPAAVAFLYLASLLYRRPTLLRLATAAQLALAAILMYVARPQFLPLAGFLVVWAYADRVLERRAAPRRLRLFAVALAITALSLMLSVAARHYAVGPSTFALSAVATVVTLPPPTWFVRSDLLQSGFMMAFLPLSLLWLAVGPGLILGGLWVVSGQLRYPGALLVASLAFCLMVAITLPLTVTVVRYRMPVEPLLMALAAEAWLMLPKLRDRARRSSVVFLVGWIALSLLASAAYSALGIARAGL